MSLDLQLKALKDALKDKIALGRIDVALKEMNNRIKDNSIKKDEIIAVSGRYNQFDRNRLQGVIKWASPVEEQIVQNVLRIINEFTIQDLIFLEENDQVELERLKQENTVLKAQVETLLELQRAKKREEDNIDFNLLKNLEGNWLEYIEGLENENRVFSIGTFKFNEVGNFTFNGTNYKADGSIHYQWNTWEIIPDLLHNPITLHLIYNASLKGQSYSSTSGYAQLFIEDKQISGGYFNDIGDGKGPLHFRAYRIEEIAKKIGFGLTLTEDNGNKKLFIQEVYKRKNDLF